ncbi:hypothetical protein L9F63_004067 [Diploptera punctata]|uniref:Uncharacterized protein n=1 Tax=Diploptera punctata TaxID=6984 RepID=A0AAD7ZGK2_DIPPU|nr:hypothetical protein L9F63_004067 [Diploptera punctata]
MALNNVSVSRENSKVLPSSSSANIQVKGTSSVVTTQSPKKNTPSANGQSSADSRKKRMGEIDRLLMDEGAINLLYEVEQGDSKRRSGILENDTSSPKRKVRSPLKSVRRQKKDLLLKTRLVKNAVMRLSSVMPSATAAIALRVRRQIGPPTLQLATGQNRLDSLQRKRSLDSRESLRSPPPLTPVDPPSPAQSFSYPPRLHLPAEASRIIRRHSSSSTFSSRSTSPNLQHRNSIDSIQSPENAENKPDNQSSKNESNNSVPCSSKNSCDLSDKKRTVVRKKGVPIFVRKLDAAQTYKGKKKNSSSASNTQNTEKLVDIKCKELKVHNKVQADSGKKAAQNGESKKRVALTQSGPSKKVPGAVKMKLKAQVSKNFQKGFQKGKPVKLKKPVSEGKPKKHGDKIDVEMPDLTSCLAAVATEFAAEAESHKKVVALRRGSNDSSQSLSTSSKSPNCSQPPMLKKEPKEPPPPLSPNASSYSTLIKSLESESQKPKRREEEVIKQRSSVRQNAGTYHYKEICLRRYDNLVQIILTPASTKMKNSLNVQVLRELRDALSQLKRDEGCRVVLLTSAGSSFCQGIDLHCLVHTNVDKRKAAAHELAQALNDKATFYTPYAKLGQVPEGAAVLTLPHLLGNAMTSELLFGCRKLTASEALSFGLVTRILWPDKFQEELIPIIRSMASQSAQSMVATKALLRHSQRIKLENAIDLELPLLTRHWVTNECQKNFQRFLEDEDVGLQRQRIDL